MFTRFFIFIGLIVGSVSFGTDLHGKEKAETRSPDQLTSCSVLLKGDTLILENACIIRKYLWNNGNIITVCIKDKVNNVQWFCLATSPDLSFPGFYDNEGNGSLDIKKIPETQITPAYIQTTILCKLGGIEVKRVFRIYPDCPAIACDVYLRGKADEAWTQQEINAVDMQNVEKQLEEASSGRIPVLEKLELPGKHWKIQSIEFRDVTDRFNNLVQETSAISYSRTLFRGNLLFATDLVSGNGLFILKESPTSNAQLAYPGSDFLTQYGTIKLLGAGMEHTDLNEEQWCRAYGFVTGIYNGHEPDRLVALRNYMQRIRIHKPDRDEMIMMNTWGDRGQDTRINEQFALAELDAGARLGINRFQLDDGWQTGRSGNSAFQGGSFSDIWRNPDYWKPNPDRFPNGLDPVVQKGKKLNIEICLWFNPSSDKNNANWEKDADALIWLNKTYGIRTFKIDGVKLSNKEAEVNFRKMLDKVVKATDGNVVFNLDVTAGKRGGYFYFNEYGTIFLENRYTDWQNYFPYWTLRNVWMLSNYVPPQNLQIEFLNKWRNQDKYGHDPFSPSQYSFDYLFAITMPAQPLAWFEGSGLPEEAFLSSSIIKKYAEIQADFHDGYIFPVGNEPSGTSWTGFQSQKEGCREGYVLIFRERNSSTSALVELPLISDGQFKFEKILGDGVSFKTNITDRKVVFSLPRENTFSLYKYILL